MVQSNFKQFHINNFTETKSGLKSAIRQGRPCLPFQVNYCNLNGKDCQSGIEELKFAFFD